LWAVADDFSCALSAEQVTAPKLADVREILRERVDLKGPWWVLGDEERSEEEAG
jgi:hypothetical protein